MRTPTGPVGVGLLAAVATALLAVAEVPAAVPVVAGLPVPLRVAATWVALLVPAYAAVRLWRRARPVPAPTPHGGISATPPDEPKWQGHVERFGVYWTAIYGRRGTDHPIEGAAGGGRERAGAGRGSTETEDGAARRPDYAHVVGPFCAECGTMLEVDVGRRLLVLARPVWRCPECGATVPRPDEAAFHEAAAVRELCEAALEPVYYGGEDRSTVDDRPEFVTASWDE